MRSDLAWGYVLRCKQTNVRFEENYEYSFRTQNPSLVPLNGARGNTEVFTTSLPLPLREDETGAIRVGNSRVLLEMVIQDTPLVVSKEIPINHVAVFER